MSIAEQIDEINPEAIAWGSGGEREYLDKAIIGWADRCGMQPVLVYSYDKLVQAFVDMWSADESVVADIKASQEADDDGLTEEDILYHQAREWVDFNIVGAYVGEYTPLMFHEFEDEEL